MKNTFLLFLFVCFAFAIQAQVDATIDKGSGWLYFSGIPGTTPNVGSGSEVAINVLAREAYLWNRDSTRWDKWLSIDSVYTVVDTLYIRQGVTLWEVTLPPGGLIDSVTYAADTLRIYENGSATPFKTAIVSADGDGIYDAAGTVAPVEDMLVKLRPDTTFAIAHTNTAGLEDYWNAQVPGNNFNGLFFSPVYWGGFGLMDARTDSAYYQFIGHLDRTVDITAEYGTGGNKQVQRIVVGSDHTHGITLDGIRNGVPYSYFLPATSPSTTLNDTTIMAWRGLGGPVAEPIGFIPLPSGGGSGADGNGIISALPAGNVTIDGNSNYLTIDSTWTYLQSPTGSFIDAADDIILNTRAGGTGDVQLLSDVNIDITSPIVNIWNTTGYEVNFQGNNDRWIFSNTINRLDISADTLDISGAGVLIGFPSGGTDDQTLSTSRDTITIETGNSVRTPGVGFIRDSITTTTLTVDLKRYNQAIISLKMTSATTLTLTVNNPWSDVAGAYPTQEGETGVYTFRFWGISGTDAVTWPANFYTMNDVALGTQNYTTGTAVTCFYDAVEEKYFCK